MDDAEMRRHLSGADRNEAVGPGRGGSETMAALSGVSIEVGQLHTRLEQMAEQVSQLAARLDTAEGQAAAIADLHTQLTAIQEALTAGQGAGSEEADPPPRPWDWAAMDRAETWQALDTLGIWARDELYPSWRRLQRRIPPCWMRHPDMRRDMSWIYVAYQQAYRDDGRRAWHETDFRRVLEDAVSSIETSAKARNCNSDDPRHDTAVVAAGRDDAAGARRALLYSLGIELGGQEWLLQKQHDQQAREHITRVRDRHNITDEEYRQIMVGAVVQLNQVATDERRASQDQRAEAQGMLELLMQRHGISEEEYRRMWAQMR